MDPAGSSSGGLQILNAAPGQVQLFWPSQTNAWYLLEGSDELSPLDWLNVWGPNPDNDSNLIVLDPIAAHRTGFIACYPRNNPPRKTPSAFQFLLSAFRISAFPNIVTASIHPPTISLTFKTACPCAWSTIEAKAKVLIQ